MSQKCRDDYTVLENSHKNITNRDLNVNDITIFLLDHGYSIHYNIELDTNKSDIINPIHRHRYEF